jgi:hypothetical protein
MAAMAYEFQVTVDCADPHTLADWWAETLGWQVEPADEAFIRRMISAGYAAESDTKLHNGVLVWKEGAAIGHPEGLQRAPRMLFQLVPEGKPDELRTGVGFGTSHRHGFPGLEDASGESCHERSQN